MSRPLASLLGPALLAVSACGTVMEPTRYSQACAVDADCAPVRGGDVCSPCGCATAAVSASDADRYRQDAEGLRFWCGPQPAVACGPCPQVEGACTQGRCTLRQL